MEYNSIFEIIGPRMMGPSSSHTAGAVLIGKNARELYDKRYTDNLVEAEIYLYGSFARTYKGHATDIATIGGILGLDPTDTRIREAYSLAQEQGIYINIIPMTGDIPVNKNEPTGENNPHLNTVKIVLKNQRGMTLSVTGVSIGGGSYKIIDVQDS